MKLQGRQEFVKTLRRGDRVRALVNLDPRGARVMEGMAGVVFEESDAYGDGCGPMVRWENGGACNVYDGGVEKIS